MHNLKILLTSSRPGRKGPALGRWIETLARQNPAFEPELVDLAEVGLPFMDEPNHPMLRQYTKEHTFAWSKKIDSADAFIVVATEYNYGFTAVFKNAIDFLYHEWKHKPVGLVGYGGIAGGTRSIQLMKPVLTALNMMPLTEAVIVPFFRQHLNESDEFIATEDHLKQAGAMLTSLDQWATALKPLRQPTAKS